MTYPVPPHLLRDSEGNLLPAKRKRGRPLKIREPKALLASEFEYIAEVNRLRREHVDTDSIVRAIENRAASPEILGRAVEEIAIEVAEIKYEIKCDEIAGRINLIDRKRGKVVDGCHKIALILLSAAKLGLLEPSLQGPRMQRVFLLFLDTVRGVARETLEAPDEFIRRCQASLTGWEDQVESEDNSVG